MQDRGLDRALVASVWGVDVRTVSRYRSDASEQAPSDAQLEHLDIVSRHQDMSHLADLSDEAFEARIRSFPAKQRTQARADREEAQNARSRARYEAFEDAATDLVQDAPTGDDTGLSAHPSEPQALAPRANDLIAALRETTTITLLPEVRASAGPGLVVYDEATRIVITVPRLLIQQLLGFDPPSHLGVLQADGNSMSPTFEDGDLLLYAPTNELNGPADYVIIVDGYVLAKRVQRIAGGGLMIISTNKRDGYIDEVLVRNPNVDIDGLPYINRMTGDPVSFSVAGRIVWPRPDAGRVHIERVAEIIRTMLHQNQ